MLSFKENKLTYFEDKSGYSHYSQVPDWKGHAFATGAKSQRSRL